MANHCMVISSSMHDIIYRYTPWQKCSIKEQSKGGEECRMATDACVTKNKPKLCMFKQAMRKYNLCCLSKYI